MQSVCGGAAHPPITQCSHARPNMFTRRHFFTFTLVPFPAATSVLRLSLRPFLSRGIHASGIAFWKPQPESGGSSLQTWHIEGNLSISFSHVHLHTTRARPEHTWPAAHRPPPLAHRRSGHKRGIWRRIGCLVQPRHTHRPADTGWAWRGRQRANRLHDHVGVQLRALQVAGDAVAAAPALRRAVLWFTGRPSCARCQKPSPTSQSQWDGEKGCDNL